MHGGVGVVPHQVQQPEAVHEAVSGWPWTVRATIQQKQIKSVSTSEKLPRRQSTMCYVHVAETSWVTTAGTIIGKQASARHVLLPS